MHSKTRYASRMELSEGRRKFGEDGSEGAASDAEQKRIEQGQAEVIKKLEAEIERLKNEVTIDALTGTYTRKGFEEKFQNEREREKRALAILMLDVDNFKMINDTYGHEEGDKALAAVGEYLRMGRRPHDIVSRWGGEEFIVAMSGAEAQDVVNSFYEKKDPERPEKERRAKINIPISLKGETGPIVITMSGGVTTYHPGEDVYEAIKRADATLYRAKETGRDRIESADADKTPETGGSLEETTKQ